MLRVPGDWFEHFEQRPECATAEGEILGIFVSQKVFWYVWIMQYTGQQQDGKVIKGLVRSLDSKRN